MWFRVRVRVRTNTMNCAPGTTYFHCFIYDICMYVCINQGTPCERLLGTAFENPHTLSTVYPRLYAREYQGRTQVEFSLGNTTAVVLSVFDSLAVRYLLATCRSSTTAVVGSR